MSHVDQDATAARPDRRAVIRGAGAVGLAAVGGTVLAACGSDSTAGATAGDTSTGGPSGGPSSAATTTTTTAGGSGGSEGVAKADIPVGGGTIVAATKTVITQPAAGEFKAFSSICTHMSCPVSQIQNGLIMCPCHGSEYKISDGSVVAGPAPRPLPPVKIKVSGGQVRQA
jgi:Rieske Fe-S protein